MIQEVHKFELYHHTCVLRSPITADEWDAYHRIRQTEIAARYCPLDYKYNFNDPEEWMTTNFRFVLVDNALSECKVVGVIRVDLLKEIESSIRWVAIAPNLQRMGYGTMMLKLVEKFVRSQGRQLIRVPAEEATRAFYEKVGFYHCDWPESPQHVSNIFLAKMLSK